MKIKLKLNGAGLKAFFVDNGEKIGCGVAAVFFVFLAYKGIAHEQIPADQDSKLRTACTAAEKHMEPQIEPWKPADAQIQVVAYAPRAKRPEVQPQGYVLKAAFDAPLTDPKIRRDDPPLLAARDVRVASGIASIPIYPEGRPDQFGNAGMPPEEVVDEEETPEAPDPRAAKKAKKEADDMLKANNVRKKAPKAPKNPARGDRGPKPQVPAVAKAPERGPRPDDPMAKNGINRGPRPGRMPAMVDTGGRGVSAPAGSKPQIGPYALVTALLPYKEQVAINEKTFSRAIDHEAARDDFPVYLRRYHVQRAEINPDDPETLDWQDVDGKKAIEFKNTWAVDMPEVVAEKYLDLLTMPLPPMLGKDWDASATHPKIPLLSRDSFRNPRGPMIPQRGPARGPAARPAGDEDDEEVDAPANEPADVAADDDDDDPGAGGRDIRGPRDPFGKAPVGGNGLMRGMPQGRAMAGGGTTRKPVEYRLFRFFDFTVEPGKQYRYRVTIEARNPNYEMKVEHLKNPDSRDKKSLTSDWSEPSPVVRIPDSTRILAGPSKSSKPDDPIATILIATIDNKLGVEPSKDFEVSRGTIANFDKIELSMVDPVKSEPLNLTTSFHTDALVVDIRGGKPFGKDKSKSKNAPTEPDEVLLLDKDGNLTVCSELEDMETFEALSHKDEPPPAAGVFQPGGPGGPPRPNAVMEQNMIRGIPKGQNPGGPAPVKAPGGAKSKGKKDVLGGS